MTRNFVEAYATAHRAGDATFPPACLRFVHDAVRTAARHLNDGHGDGAASLSPAETVRVLADAARREFGPLDAVVRAEWGLLDGADAGRAVRLLSDCGALTLAPGDTEDAFAAVAWPGAEDRP